MKGRYTSTMFTWDERTKRIVTVLAGLSMCVVVIWAELRHFTITFDVLLNGISGHRSQEYFVFTKKAGTIVLALSVGAGLAVSGAVMQGIFRNPMASPYTLGLSNAASFGAALFIYAGNKSLAIFSPLCSFFFCFAGMAFIFRASKIKGKLHPEVLLLAGITMGFFFLALKKVVISMSDSEQIKEITYWGMGTVYYSLPWGPASLILATVIPGILFLKSRSRELNAIMISDSQAQDLGIDTNRVRVEMVLVTTAIVAICVSFCGSIGFIGLIIPHMVRLILGPENSLLIPASAFGGGAFLLACDYISMYLNSEFFVYLPVGVVTALIGAPYFVYLLHRQKREMGWT